MLLKADYGEIPTSPIKTFPPTAFQQKECQKGLLGQSHVISTIPTKNASLHYCS